jgi:fructosamine-3-kinase
MTAEQAKALQAVLERAQLPPMIAAEPMSGGCIHRVFNVTLRDGTHVAAKVNDASVRTMLEGEATSLRALEATNTIHVPRVVGVYEHEDTAVMLTSFIHQCKIQNEREMWRHFGDDLARLHTAALPEPLSRGYGFPADNHLGSTPQPNAWRDDWIEFNAKNRLGHQLRLAQSRRLLTADEMRAMNGVIDRLDRILPQRPPPALLHGDLWSGNVLLGAHVHAQSNTTTCAVIDPACSVGDALADIAMMRLFGGSPLRCIEAWTHRMRVDLTTEESVRRMTVYQLYHVLNHVNIFGRGYVSQAVSLARSLY